MAVKKSVARVPQGMTLSLYQPGLTPLLRAGLGGLAASLYALERKGLPFEGSFQIYPDRVELDWSACGLETFFGRLFDLSFRLTVEGTIDLPGTYEGVRPGIALRSALQDAMTVSILQHPKHLKWPAKVKGATTRRVPHMVSIDGKDTVVSVQPYEGFVHQEQWPEICEALQTGSSLALSGWASPGAVQRHGAHAATSVLYSVSEALCACFALVGCIPLLMPGGGVLVIPEPDDLRQFARVRPKLTPRSVPDVYVSGLGDAVLAVEALLRMDALEERPGVGAVHAMRFGTVIWNSKQKRRVDAFSGGPLARFDESVLTQYGQLVRQLPARVIRYKVDKEHTGVFYVPSSLRAFVADNVVRREPWYRGFTTARDLQDRNRFLHLRRRQDNLGALRPQEVEGVRLMSGTLGEAEKALVGAVQSALRRRYGAIFEECKNGGLDHRKRLSRESERWRLSFKGAKTIAQLRGALSDLWSRAGRPPELAGEGWMAVMNFINQDWEAARDLSLVALAAYKGREVEAEEDEAATEETPLPEPSADTAA